MVINKLKTEEIKVNITDVKVPTLDMFPFGIPYLIPVCDNKWWIKDKKNRSTLVPCVMTNNEIKWVDKDLVRGLRPVIFYEQDEERILLGDELLVDNYLFTVFEHGKAICNTVIDFAPYYKVQAGKTLSIDVCMKSWEKTFLRHQAVKVIKTEQYDIPLSSYNIDILTLEDYNNGYCAYNAKPHYDHWLKGRADEFNAYMAPRIFSHPAQFSSLDTQNYVCPAIFVKPFSGMEIDLAVTTRYALNGNVLAVFRANASEIVFRCLSPIGRTCYSTGICEVGNSKEENLFFLDSEVAALINEWAYNNILRKTCFSSTPKFAHC